MNQTDDCLKSQFEIKYEQYKNRKSSHLNEPSAAMKASQASIAMSMPAFISRFLATRKSLLACLNALAVVAVCTLVSQF